jgi:hypothetical protein
MLQVRARGLRLRETQNRVTDDGHNALGIGRPLAERSGTLTSGRDSPGRALYHARRTRGKSGEDPRGGVTRKRGSIDAAPLRRESRLKVTRTAGVPLPAVERLRVA